MRRVLTSAVLAVAMVAGSGTPVRADPPDPAPGPGWQVGDGTTLTWTAPEIVMGDAAVEFYAGDRLLGRPDTTDHRTFRLRLGKPTDPGRLQVRAGGRRLDAPATRARRTATTPTLPGLGRPGPVDPGTPGPYATRTGEYTLPGLRLPDYPADVEMQAVVVAPRNAPGRRPLALFLHGRHFTCFQGDDEEQITGDWPCPETHDAVPSHRGYLQAQRLLASQGYLTVSISANGINGQDFRNDDGGAQARSSLVRAHLARWADWSGARRAGAPAIVRAAPRADLSRVLLVGHSRGGEGVNRAAMDSLRPPPAAQDGYRGRVRWTIRGTFLIGPTIFGHNPAPDVPSATILPGCDGDVADLQGQLYVDATDGVSRGRALHSALYAIGANHNFFNTEWTPGQAVAPAFDDFPTDLPDPVCAMGTPTRLTPGQQQRAGATYIAAAARLFVGGDDRVRPLLDGTGVRAPSADPARVLSHALGANRTPLIIPERRVRAAGAGRICDEVSDDPARVCLPPGEDAWWSPSPHFVAFNDVAREPGRSAVAMRWSAPGQTVSLRPRRAVPVRGELALRIMVPPDTSGTRFGVTVTDDRGRRTRLGEVRVDGLPGSPAVTPYWAQEVRVPLRKPQRVAKLELVPRGGAGRAWLMDAWGWRPGTPAPKPVALPRIDIGSLSVTEGDSGTRTHHVPVTVTGRGHGQVRVFLIDAWTYESRSWLATVRPGQRTVPVPIRVLGNTRYGNDEEYMVGMKAVRGLLIGDHLGDAVVLDDDPAPAVTVTPVADTVAEGGTLSWQFTLSEPAEAEIYVLGTVRPPDGPELSSTDVDPDWFREQAFEEPEPSRPLSETYLSPYAVVPAGELTAEITVPTVTDDLAEPDERIRLELAASGRDEAQDLGTVVGTVTS